MKKLFGVILVLAGIVAGLFVGLYLMFIGGIIQIVDGVNAKPDANGAKIGWGIVRVLLGGAAGGLTCALFIGAAAACFGSKKRPALRRF